MMGRFVNEYGELLPDESSPPEAPKPDEAAAIAERVLRGEAMGYHDGLLPLAKALEQALSRIAELEREHAVGERKAEEGQNARET